MQISIQSRSMVPIYEQVVDQFQAAIIQGELQPGNAVPSVRALARELGISALTVKKAYDQLAQEGYLVVVQGKGAFVAETDKELILEEHQKKVEALLEEAIDLGLQNGINRDEIRSIFDMIMEEK